LGRREETLEIRLKMRLNDGDVGEDGSSIIEQLLGRKLEPKNIRILVSLGQRFPIVAAFFSLSENDWDIFESPFQFRSRYKEGNVERGILTRFGF
jgi:hypothetical protein